jgi:formiminotetrahydrofolate cyclodeaminase
MPPMSGAPSAATSSLDAFTRQLASSAPVPGGGSASAVAASLAASLVAMVARLSQDRPRYAEHAALHDRSIAAADAAREHLLQLADDDARAYQALMESRRLPHADDGESAVRAGAMAEAAATAAEVPLAIVTECVRIIDTVAALRGRSNVNAASDLNVAALLAGAAARGAAENVRVNLPDVEAVQPGDAQRIAAELDELLDRLERVVGQPDAGAATA